MDRPDQLEYFGALNRLMGVASPRPTDASAASSDGPSGAVIGGAVGGAVFLLAIIGALVFFLCRRRRRKQRLASGAEVGGQDGAAAMKQNKGAFATASPQAGGLSRTYNTYPRGTHRRDGPNGTDSHHSPTHILPRATRVLPRYEALFHSYYCYHSSSNTPAQKDRKNYPPTTRPPRRGTGTPS
jgi:hypothetical protein